MALILHAALAITACFCPPALNSDSATGFLVWDAWQHGAPWNHMIIPDAANLRRDVTVFQAWWSPGQYLVVAPWQWLGLSLGHAIALGGFIATALSLLGFWRLFLKLGFVAATSGWAVLAIACNWTLTRTYGDYMGGELALFAVLPWLVLATRWAVNAGFVSWLAVPALYWAGNMAKNSYIPMAAGLIAGFRGAQLWGRPIVSAKKVVELTRWFGWLALGHLVLWLSYLRLGVNPSVSNAGESHPVWWQALAQLIGFPVTSIFSIGNMLGRIFLHPTHPRVGSMAELWPLHLALAVVAIAVMAWVLRREAARRKDYAWLMAGVLGAYAAFFLLLLIVGAAAGWEERMLKPAGFLLLPGLIDAIRAGTPRWAARAAGAALLLASLYGVAAALNRAHHLARLDNVGRRGISQHVLSREALRVLHALDDTLPADALLVVPSPEMALELRRVRVMATHAAMSTPRHLAAASYHGQVGDLVVLVDRAMEDRGQAQALLASLKDYPPASWKIHEFGAWRFYPQGTFTSWPEPEKQAP